LFIAKGIVTAKLRYMKNLATRLPEERQAEFKKSVEHMLRMRREPRMKIIEAPV